MISVKELQSIIIYPNEYNEKNNQLIDDINKVLNLSTKNVKFKNYYVKPIMLNYVSLIPSFLFAPLPARDSNLVYTISSNEYMCDPIGISSYFEYLKFKKQLIKTIQQYLLDHLDKKYSKKEIKNALRIKPMKIKYDSAESNRTLSLFDVEAYTTHDELLSHK